MGHFSITLSDSDQPAIDTKSCIDITNDQGVRLILTNAPYNLSGKDCLSALLADSDLRALSNINGHFAGVLIRPDNTAQIFTDRTSSHCVYIVQQKSSITLSTRWSDGLTKRNLDPRAKAETLMFRLPYGDDDIFVGRKRLPTRHYGEVTPTSINFIAHPHAFPYEPVPASNIDIKIKETRAALVDFYRPFKEQHSSVAVLLSGGVDSSLLALLATEVFDKVTAYTPVFEGDFNPELERAKDFAHHLNIEHKLITVKEADLAKDLVELTLKMGYPLRNFSSLATHAMIKHIDPKDTAIIYGELADTLFGAQSWLNHKANLDYRQRYQYVPKALRKLLSKHPGFTRRFWPVNKSDGELYAKSSLLKLSTNSLQYIDQLVDGSAFATCNIVKDIDQLEGHWLNKLRHVVMRGDVCQHFREILLSINQNHCQLLSPFTDTKVQLIARKLPMDMMVGTHNKPILKAIAAEGLPKEHIYAKKYGFDTPTKRWLRGPLKPFTDHVIQSLDQDINIDDDFNLIWGLIGLAILTGELKMPA